jgi:hypothetical protein
MSSIPNYEFEGFQKGIEYLRSNGLDTSEIAAADFDEFTYWKLVPFGEDGIRYELTRWPTPEIGVTFMKILQGE